MFSSFRLAVSPVRPEKLAGAPLLPVSVQGVLVDGMKDAGTRVVMRDGESQKDEAVEGARLCRHQRPSCGTGEIHSCPYRVEVYDDFGFCCRCCEFCTDDCAGDV